MIFKLQANSFEPDQRVWSRSTFYAILASNVLEQMTMQASLFDYGRERFKSNDYF